MLTKYPPFLSLIISMRYAFLRFNPDSVSYPPLHSLLSLKKLCDVVHEDMATVSL